MMYSHRQGPRILDVNCHQAVLRFELMPAGPEVPNMPTSFFQDGPFPASFSLFSSFPFQCTIGRFNFADVGIQTADLWCRKQPLYQLSHHHCPKSLLVSIEPVSILAITSDIEWQLVSS